MRFRSCFLFPILLVASCTVAPALAVGESHTSQPFQGVKADKGRVTLASNAGPWTLTLSNDFVVPATPAPHWQVVDGRGNVFLLQRLVAKDQKYHQSIVVPAHVQDVAKVQIWCAFAETLLGETSFGKVIDLRSKPVLHTVATSTPFAGGKANKGTVAFGHQPDQRVLVLSDDFAVPDTPAPHWQLVDRQGRTYLLERLVAKDGKYNQTLAVPAYVKDVAKVQIWCAFAETLLGEAKFAAAQM